MSIKDGEEVGVDSFRRGKERKDADSEQTSVKDRTFSVYPEPNR